MVPQTVVLRWGHRPRDFRVTTHVALTARVFGANGLILSDVEDYEIKTTVASITKDWGGEFSIEIGKPWREAVQEWRRSGGIVVHLTMYGENVETSNVVERIRGSSKKILVLVGSQKVPREFYSKEISDFNVSIGNQPHSEVAALAVFLDRLYQGRELDRTFEKARLRVVPTPHGKHLIEN